MSLIAIAGGPLATGARNGVIALWNPQTVVQEARFDAHTATVGALVQIDEGRFASGSWDGEIRIWNIGARKLETTLAGIRTK
jgi:WD40 repeat protein